MVPKRLARSVRRRDRDSLAARGVRLSLGADDDDPNDPMGKCFFNSPFAMFAEFEVDLLRMRTREGMAIARARGKLRSNAPKLGARRRAHLITLHEGGRAGADTTPNLLRGAEAPSAGWRRRGPRPSSALPSGRCQTSLRLSQRRELGDRRA